MTRRLSPAVLDFLWESMDAGEMPYPLTLRSHGTTLDERSRLRAQVLSEVDEDDLREWLAVLVSPTESIDSVFEGTATLTATNGHDAVLAVQTDEALTLTRIDRSSIVSAAVAQLPPHPRGKEHSITVRESDLAALSTGRPAGHSATDRQILQSLSAQPKLRAGQLAANTRTTMGTRRRSPVVSWFDTPSGRYLTYSNKGQDNTTWITIAPADAPTLRHHLGEHLRTMTTPAR